MMSMRNRNFLRFTGAVLALGLSLAATASAQTNDASPDSDSGPVRLARFSFVQGDVTWRPDENSDWSAATVNLPLRQGGQIWVNGTSRAEIQFDDGSVVRLGGGAVATLQTLYSDAKGEFTEIKLNSGLASLSLRSDLSEYQLDTPLASVKAYGPARVRVGADDELEVAVRAGEAVVEGGQGEATVRAGEYLDAKDDASAFDVEQAPAEDGWDRFCDDRDDALTHPDAHLPSNVALVAGDLDRYGSWRHDADYGWVWCPRVASAWRPYHEGRWVWLEPYGWTWCGAEAWGWAPYHYGTWFHAAYGWAWRPGPTHQYWCPAVVNFTSYNGDVCWCPLAPREVVYPSVLSIGFGGRSWWLSFSIGGAACYYPGPPGVCVARPWHNHYANTVAVVDVRHVGGEFRPYDGHFVPRNARLGAVYASPTQFATGGRYAVYTGPHSVTVFQKGRSFVAAGPRPFAGPAVRPERVSFSATRTFVNRHPAAAVLSRPVFRASVPATVARHGAPIERTYTPSTRPARPSGGQASRPAGTDRYRRFDSVSHNPFSDRPRRAEGEKSPRPSERPARSGSNPFTDGGPRRSEESNPPRRPDRSHDSGPSEHRRSSSGNENPARRSGGSDRHSGGESHHSDGGSRSGEEHHDRRHH